MKQILILPGDGIGKEVCNVTLPIFDILNLPINITIGDIGWEYWCKEGDPIPPKTWEQIKKSDAVILGAITSKPKKAAEDELIDELKGQNLKYVSPVIQLRQKLGLYANIRPAYQIIGNNKPFRFTVIRENTEGLYSGIDIKGIPSNMTSLIKHPNIDKSGYDNTTMSVRLQTEFGLKRLFEFAFKYAIDYDLKKVTLADKPNVLRESGQFASDIFNEIALKYPQIIPEIQNVDALALKIVKRPEEFGVIVAENMFGDILSDLASGVMGGLGLAASANIGENTCYFEPVHGSFPSKVNKNMVNPSAMFLSVALALRHVNFPEAASKIEHAVKQVIKQGKFVTYDLGGDSSTTQMAEAIIEEVKEASSTKIASILCIGNELLQGKVLNKNAQDFSTYLSTLGYEVYQHIACNDNMAAIISSLYSCVGHSDLIIVNGGLGPTSDDITRESIAKYLNVPLEYNPLAMEHITKRLKGFNLNVDLTNQRQAMFPEGSKIIPNENGTAIGFDINWKEKRIIALPGPPHEAIPMLANTITEKVKNNITNKVICMLIGISESDIGTLINPVLEKYQYQPDIEYLLQYPYVKITLIFNKEPSSEFINDYFSLLNPYIVTKSEKTALESIYSISDFTPISQDDLSLDKQLIFEVKYTNSSNQIVRATINLSMDNGIAPPWTGIINTKCTIETTDKITSNSIQIPKSGVRVVSYINEFIAWNLLKHLN